MEFQAKFRETLEKVINLINKGDLPVWKRPFVASNEAIRVEQCLQALLASDENWTAPYREEPPKPFDLIPQAEHIITKTRAAISHEPTICPSYKVVDDIVVLPPLHEFKSQASYYSTVFHELAHWTGSPYRLSRPTLGRDPQHFPQHYAYEECVAELASVFICSLLGITEDLERSCAYLRQYYDGGRLESDDFGQAANRAVEAAEFILQGCSDGD